MKRRLEEERVSTERQRLPIFSARRRLLQHVRRHETVVVLGHTGSGKSTQVPQYLLDCGLNLGSSIAITQPRRIAAVTVATRVAQERSVELGTTVGYCVRFDDTSSPKTKIRYMTDGMLLREAMLDPLLKRYSIIILDEAHERTLHTDILLGVVKTAQAQRRQNAHQSLKVIVMSATMEVDRFSTYFNDCPILYIEGRQYPIKIMYAKEPQQDYLFSATVSVFQIHQEFPPTGDILVFLTGQEEIESATKSMRDISSVLTKDCAPLRIFPLYATLPPALQMMAFKQMPKGCRKVVVATNVAETSITMTGIKYVVDTGFVKTRVYQHGSGLESLKIQRISKAQAWQRCGRAGREQSGICYRLYTEADFSQFKDTAIPEIQRSNLASVMLQMLTLGISNPATFDFIDSPFSEAIEDALEQLELLIAIEKPNEIILTDLGRQMAMFPVDPKLAKIILASKDLGCMDEILTIIAMLSVDSVTYVPLSARDEAAAARKKFASNEGDVIMLLEIFRAYKKVNGNKHWCRENFIHARNLKMAGEIRHQLVEICERCKIPRLSCGRNHSLIRKCLVKGLFMNSAELQPSKEYKTLASRRTVSIHPLSCLFQTSPVAVVYTELVETNKTYMKNLCLVDPQWLIDAAPSSWQRRNLISKAQ